MTRKDLAAIKVNRELAVTKLLLLGQDLEDQVSKRAAEGKPCTKDLSILTEEDTHQGQSAL